MNTCEKNYFIKWLNINPVKETLEAMYGVNITLDTGETAQLSDHYLIMQGDDYKKIFDIAITVDSIETTLGELITFLTSQIANLNNIQLPIEAEVANKLGSVSDKVLSSAENTNL